MPNSNDRSTGPRDGRLAIIGPYPLPFGGISVHVQRTLGHLSRLDVPVDFYNESHPSSYGSQAYDFSRKSIKLWHLVRMLFGNYRVIHHHSPDVLVRVFLCVLGWAGKNVYLHIHGASLKDTLAQGGLKAFLLARLLRYVHVLADNAEIAELATSLKARSVTKIDAFLPPVFEGAVLEQFRKDYPLESQDYDLVISMVGWFTKYQGVDLYGFDLIADAVRELATRHRVVVVASINRIEAPDLHEAFLSRLKEAGIQDCFRLIYEDLEEIWPIYVISDVFVRPTVTDGNALSIKEALWFETPALASDCVDRPEGVQVFANRDRASFVAALEGIISKRSELKSIAEKIPLAQAKVFKNRLFEQVYGISQ